MGRVLILEDDSVMAEWLENSIRTRLADLRPEVELLETEADFVLKWLPDFDRGLETHPAVFVIDVMLRWTDPAPDQPPRSPEAVEGGFTRAGLRCATLIRRHAVLSASEVILFTALAKEDMVKWNVSLEGLVFVPKDDGNAVLEPIRAALVNAAHTSRGQTSATGPGT